MKERGKERRRRMKELVTYLREEADSNSFVGLESLKIEGRREGFGSSYGVRRRRKQRVRLGLDMAMSSPRAVGVDGLLACVRRRRKHGLKLLF
ncbi:hypothetical protein KFK09_001441 [Dendrobium nobile]|uniref:Uncharacterized protein n=1 Tax=Dendrobium nobile TaxID=94219 RepID=A0A8T3C7B9_DENNO|nr:hypothetical protein KFK09_001441 [Dendrobium nobile]